MWGLETIIRWNDNVVEAKQGKMTLAQAYDDVGLCYTPPKEPSEDSLNEQETQEP